MKEHSLCLCIRTHFLAKADAKVQLLYDMAKFFLKKDEESKRPTHSQIVGIIWVSILLLLFAGITFFMKNRGDSKEEKADSALAIMANLKQKEDSVYQKKSKDHTTRYARASWTNSTAKQGNSQSAYDSVRPARRQPLVVELNSADTTTLQLLYGIGAERARRITRYRERLGGFRNTGQLLEVYGITPKLVADLEPHLTIDTTSIRRIEINNIGLKQLIRHPYIEYYQARDIIRLRDKGQTFRTADDLRAVSSMADSTLERLLPYIDFGVK